MRWLGNVYEYCSGSPHGLQHVYEDCDRVLKVKSSMGIIIVNHL